MIACTKSDFCHSTEPKTIPYIHCKMLLKVISQAKFSNSIKGKNIKYIFFPSNYLFSLINRITNVFQSHHFQSFFCLNQNNKNPVPSQTANQIDWSKLIECITFIRSPSALFSQTHASVRVCNHMAINSDKIRWRVSSTIFKKTLNNI